MEEESKTWTVISESTRNLYLVISRVASPCLILSISAPTLHLRDTSLRRKAHRKRSSCLCLKVNHIFLGELRLWQESVGYRVERSGTLDWSFFAGYHHRRTNSTKDTTKPAAERDARIYLFDKALTKEEYEKLTGKKSKKKAEDSDDE